MSYIIYDSHMGNIHVENTCSMINLIMFFGDLVKEDVWERLGNPDYHVILGSMDTEIEVVGHDLRAGRYRFSH